MTDTMTSQNIDLSSWETLYTHTRARALYRVLVGKPEGKKPLVDPGVDGKIILRWIFRKWNVEVWTGSSWVKVGTVGAQL